MYSIGDKIVYPMHGAGVIESIEKKDFQGKKQDYYIMRMPTGAMTVMLPALTCDEIGVRYIIDKSEAIKVIEDFKVSVVESDGNWNKRHRDNLIKIRTGDIYQVANVVKELMLREKQKGLSTSERKMLSSAKNIMISELVLCEFANELDIENIINYIVEELL